MHKYEGLSLLVLRDENLELRDEGIDSSLSVNLVIASADVDGSVLLLLGSNDQDKVVLSNLGQGSLLGKHVIRGINIAIISCLEDGIADLLTVCEVLLRNGEDNALTWR